MIQWNVTLLKCILIQFTAALTIVLPFRKPNKQFLWQTQQYYFNPALSDDFSVYILLQATVHETLDCIA